MVKCAGCEIEIIGASHTICAQCGALFCRGCADKSLDACPKCGFEG